jgi:hypothetical protein
LGRLFEHLAKDFLAATQEFLFQVAKVLIDCTERVVQLAGQMRQQLGAVGWQQ